MRVVADSHALVWYLFEDSDQRLSPAADAALEQAATTEGIAVSTASVLDLWYLSQTRGVVSSEQLRGIVELLDDPASPLEDEPITMTITAAFEQIPLTVLRDPWDRLITATAMALEIPLVTADHKIRGSGLVETIW